MKILGIETSCDETAASVVEDGVKILSDVVVSQIDIFAEYGGVIPEVAARSHLEAIMPVVNKALKDAGCTWEDIDAIAVTHAPGLLGSLLVGTLTARTLAILHNKPLYATHHLKSHVYSNWLQGAGVADVSQRRGVRSAAARGVAPAARGARPLGRELPKANGPAGRAPEREISDRTPAPMFPLIALVVSGGHTQILYMPAHNQFEIIGTTQDDAVGECFDKVAKILGLPYPGGPSIAKAAEAGNPQKYKLPHPNVKGLDFSFSGLKTAVLRAVQKELSLPISHPSHDLKNHLTPEQVADFAASFQKTAVDILTEKIATAIQAHPEVKSIVVAGGVSANQLLKSTLETYVKNQGLAFFCPDPKLSGDNGAMVAAAAYYEIKSGIKPTDPYTLNIYPRISIESH
ncbi:tRNA (adenosine(37)-N6)-threonylcarbamoyltransferase complex transferase subunit TsaD [Candidatus Saccharibacteria bacterium]|nr:tRNA (adenosine(37)-N6)-threonylcarbamoyltransferase complex transferase subunit TsaD [Candidatus Saccharibacteria bacterium]